MKRLTVIVLALFFSLTASAQNTHRAPDGELPDDMLVYAQDGELLLLKLWQNYEPQIDVIFDSNELQASEPEWSSDGTTIAFIGSDAYGTDIYLWSSYLPVRMTNTPEIESELRWSPDDTHLSFTQKRDIFAESDLAVLDLSDESVQVLAEDVAPCCHEWLDNEHLVFIPLLFGEEKQITLAEPHIYLPYDGENIRRHEIGVTLYDLIYPMAGARVSMIEESPSELFRIAIYILDTGGAYEQHLVVYDDHRNELRDLPLVKDGGADWRPVNGWPE